MKRYKTYKFELKLFQVLQFVNSPSTGVGIIILESSDYLKDGLRNCLEGLRDFPHCVRELAQLLCFSNFLHASAKTKYIYKKKKLTNLNIYRAKNYLY